MHGTKSLANANKFELGNLNISLSGSEMARIRALHCFASTYGMYVCMNNLENKSK